MQTVLLSAQQGCKSLSFLSLPWENGAGRARCFPTRQLRPRHVDRVVRGRVFQAELALLEESAAEALACCVWAKPGNHLGRELSHILIKG